MWCGCLEYAGKNILNLISLTGNSHDGLHLVGNRTDANIFFSQSRPYLVMGSIWTSFFFEKNRILEFWILFSRQICIWDESRVILSHNFCPQSTTDDLILKFQSNRLSSSSTSTFHGQLWSGSWLVPLNKIFIGVSPSWLFLVRVYVLLCICLYTYIYIRHGWSLSAAWAYPQQLCKEDSYRIPTKLK